MDRGDVRKGRRVDRGDVRRGGGWIEEGSRVDKGDVRRKRWVDKGVIEGGWIEVI